MSYIDGKRGDDDLVVNGTILNNASGLSLTTSTSESNSSSGQLSYLSVFILTVIRIFRTTKISNVS